MANTLQIEDILKAHQEQRLALVSIDLQYMCQNSHRNTKSENARYESYNQDCAMALDFYRQKKVPIIHVGQDLINIHHFNKKDHRAILLHCNNYRFNQNDLCIDQRSNDILCTDMLHVPEQGETVYLKSAVSAFNTDRILDETLKKRHIDTLLFIGAFTTQCVHSSMVNAQNLGYKVAGLTDLMESDSPERNKENRFHVNNRFFQRNAPSMLMTSQEVVGHALRDFDLTKANKTVAAASLRL